MQHLSTRLLKFCAMCLIMLMMHNSRAQYVTIPDPVFATWLNANGFSGCITGNQLDTTCPAVLSATIMRCYAQNIHDLTGIQYFKNLDSLDCSNDSISFIPALPPALRSLNCQLNSLTGLPALPASIRILNCNADRIINLPQLPAGMQYLHCENNKITSLPTLPAALLGLNCIQNQLTSLPALPSALTDLACDYNQLTALPALPSGLINLACSYNQLTGLPALPSTVLGINCTGNPITSLPALPAGLLQLFCIQNNLTALPPLPPTLIGLYCYINQISSLPALPSTLIYLSCDNNRLTSIPALPPQLFMLACNHNLITSLPALPPTVVTFQCGFNQLTSLPDLPDTLNTFYCNDNPNLACLPQLKKVHDLQFQNTAITCLPDYGKVDNSTPALGALPLCGIFNPGGCGVYWNISGRTFYDVNNNCTFDSIDIGQNYIKVTLDSAGNTLQQVFTGGEGFYSFQAAYGNYKLTVDTANLPFVLQCPDSGYLNSDISATDSLSYNNDFSFRCRTLGFDLGVRSILNDYLVPRPNGVIGVNIIAGDISELYGAHCASGIGGQVQISFNGPVTYAGPAAGALTPTTISSNLLTYNIADFGMVNDFNAFNGLYQVNANAAPNAPICFTVTVTPATGDYNPANNTLSYCFSVLDAIDPNEKEVYPAHIDSAGQWLTYTIRFQNTGTAPALNIRVTDTLDNNLDPSTFQLLAYSAKNITQLFGNDVVFNFPNINLPDSATGDSASRGYVQYRVKTRSNLALAGQAVSNTASIYFDLNGAVVTNTVIDSVRQQPCTPDTITQFGGLCAGDSVYFYGTYIPARAPMIPCSWAVATPWPYLPS